MSEKQIVKRMATCNSCEHFKEARLGNWVGYTPVCTQPPTRIGINEYKEGSEKTVTWLFNCTEALFCPNYKKADDDYVSRVRKGMKLCHPDSADEPYNQIYTDRQYYKTEDGRKVLENLGVKKAKEKRCKQLTSTKLSYEQMKCEIENLKEENKKLKLKLEEEQKLNEQIKVRFVKCSSCTEEMKDKCLMFEENLCEGEKCDELIDLVSLINESEVNHKLNKAKEIIERLMDIINHDLRCFDTMAGLDVKQKAMEFLKECE